MKKLTLTTLLVLLCVLARAVPFLIGAYAQYDLNNDNNGDDNVLKTKLLEAGYNAATITVYDDLTRLDSLLGTFGGDVKTLLSDKYWDYQNQKVGINSLSYGNYLKMEAEYDYKFDDAGVFDPDTDVDDGTSDVYNYIFAHSCGGLARGPHSNGHAWVCDESDNDQHGFALSNPRFRWLLYPSHSYPRSIGSDFKFYKDALKDNYLYLTVAMKFSDLDVAPDTLVATIGLRALTYMDDWYEAYDLMINLDPNDTETYHSFVLISVKDSVRVSTSIYGNNAYYENVGIERDDWGNLVFEYRTKLPDPDTQEVLYNDLMKDHYGGSFFRHIVPEVKWNGKGRMELDYIIIEDEFHRQARLGGSHNMVFPMLNTRFTDINRLTNHENIIYYMTKGEPFQGQFDMYNKMENYLGVRGNLLTPVNLEGYTAIKQPNGGNYEHYINFLKQAKPKTIAIDAYPLGEGGPNTDKLIQWNNSASDLFVQKKIDNIVTKTYHSLAKAVKDSINVDAKIVYIPQIYGEYVPKVLGNPNSGVAKWRTFMPPLSMIKCLQFLPLCYDAGGILDFTLLAANTMFHEEEDDYYRVAPLTHSSDYTNLDITANSSAYQYLTEANQKIAIYGPYLSGLTWENAECLMTYGGVDGISLPLFKLASLTVIDPYDIPRGGDPTPILPPYTGYVQCGYYLDDQSSPTFMLVNRRAVYRTTAQDKPVGYNANSGFLGVDVEFENANSQTVNFVPSAEALTHFGSDVALHDRYDGELYRGGPTGINVSIGPGDGKLLEMCGTLPHEVTANSTLSNKAVIGGSINILPGVSVTTNSSTETKILRNSVINIGAGASYTLRGDVTVEDGARFVVAQNGSLFFDNAVCTWGDDSCIQVDRGTLSINNSVLDGFSSNRWKGLDINNSDSVTINNSTLSNAEGHTIVNSNLYVGNTKFIVPEHSTGLSLENNVTGRSTNIINTVSDRGFYGVSHQTSDGIVLSVMKNQVHISKVNFNNLVCGIAKQGYPHASNTISECIFTNCGMGIRLSDDKQSTEIQQCSFSNVKNEKQNTGVYLSASSPEIFDCNFSNLYCGILTEMSLTSGLAIETFIEESYFYDCVVGIESKNSNHPLKMNYFCRNDMGIVNHASSNLNLSYTANNVLMNKNHNIVFVDTTPYNSTIQLFTGYNDFYHENEFTGETATDFSFDPNYCASLAASNFPIDASYNWFQGNQVTVNDTAYADYVYVGTYNSEPSMPDPPPMFNRMCTALDHESQELYDLAAATYQAIIDDQLVAEKPHVTSAIDGLYRCSGMTSTPLGETIAYFDAKAAQHAVDSPSLSAILKDYLLKLHLVNKDFQSAVDLLQLRISDPVSEVDSLRAVLDLEIVLQLAAAEGTKRPVITEYTQFQYPNFQVFEVMHSKNWEKYRQALQKNNPNMANIPAFPIISNNYPNPFNPSTTIAYSIPEDGLVKIDIYNIRGQKVKQLCNTEMLRGRHKVIWDGKDKNGRSVSSGVYFVRLQANGQTSARKIMLMK